MKEFGIALLVLLELLTLDVIYGMIGREGLIFIGIEMILAKFVLVFLRWIRICPDESHGHLYICIFLPPIALTVMLAGNALY